MRIKRIHFPLIHSTNSWGKEHAHDLDPSAFTIITADEQSEGRGRFNRQWISPKGCNLYVSYVFFLEQLTAVDLGNIPQILALAAYDIVRAWVPSVRLKWPNDLVIHSKKIAGILCEVTQVSSTWAVIAGIGLNVNMSAPLIKTIDRPATSLMLECQRPFKREQIAEKLHRHFHKLLGQFLKDGFAPFFETFAKALVHLPNDPLQLHDFTQTIQGNFIKINEDGSLLLRLRDGSCKRFISGELV